MAEFEFNELNKNSKGGTELMISRLFDAMNPELMDKFQIIPSRVRELKDDKIRVYWLHDLPYDPESEHLKKQENVDKFQKIVFASNWQMQQYQSVLGLKPGLNTTVIENAIVPIDFVEKSKDEIRIVYTSTPQRGLEILIPVFEQLSKKYDNIYLDVFSSFKIYGWDNADKDFEPLYEKCRNHPKIVYHGFKSNDEVRSALQKAHIFAYPSIWMETSCLALIEAMSAGLLCVHPNFAALPDTSGGLTQMYDWVEDKNIHANILYTMLENSVRHVNDERTQQYLQFVKYYADTRFNTEKMKLKWESLLQSLAAQYENTDLSLQKKYMTIKFGS